MPLISELRAERHAATSIGLRALAALGRTRALARKADAARRVIDRWRTDCARPALSVSGGKDSTALLLLGREVDPDIPVYRAAGPARLQYSDAPAYLERLMLAAGGPWVVCAYEWDVEALLKGRAEYTPGHKRRALRERMQADDVDGVALGIRAAESVGRRASVRVRGLIYRVDWRLTCTPLAGWTAEEVLGYVLAADRVPLHPVYSRTHLQPSLEHLRDGGWLPHGWSDTFGYRGWLAWHYPEHLQDYDHAVIAMRGGR